MSILLAVVGIQSALSSTMRYVKRPVLGGEMKS